MWLLVIDALFTWKTKFWRLLPWLAMLRQWQTVNTDSDWHWKHSDVVCQIALNGITKARVSWVAGFSCQNLEQCETNSTPLIVLVMDCTIIQHLPFSAQVRINPLLFIPQFRIIMTRTVLCTWPFTWLASHSCIIIMISRAKVIVSNPIMSTVHKPCLSSTTQ